MLRFKGEIWAIDSRKGRLTIKLLEDVGAVDDMFFDAELVAGTPYYLSRDRTPEATGETLTFRTSMTEFIRREDD